jgi:hypothetical protein
MVFKNMNEWFKANLLSLNFDKTYFMKFQTKNSSLNEMNITNNNKIISNTSNLKFLGFIIDNTLSWKSNIDMIAPKLSQTCFIASDQTVFIKRYPKDDLLCVFPRHYALWANILGNSSHSGNIFKLQKRTIRIIMGARPRDSCRELFKVLKILPLTSQYIFSLALFVANNKSLFKDNSEVRNIKTRNNSSLFQLSSHLTIYQKGSCYFCITVYNTGNLPSKIGKLSHNIKQFKAALRDFLQIHSFYTLVEYFDYKIN